MDTLPIEGAEAREPSGPFDRALTRVEDALVIVAGMVVFALMFYGTADVISRAAFNRPLPSTYEFMELGMVAIVYLGVAQVQRLRGHVAVDFLQKYFSPRVKEAIDLIGCVTGLVLMSAIAWWGALAAWDAYVTGEYIGSVARVPVYPARVALVIGVVVLLLRLALELGDHLKRIASRNGAEAPLEPHR